MKRHVTLNISVYPISTVYASGVLVAYALTAGWIGLGTGVIALTMIATLAVLVSMHREVQVVHHLVNAQRDALLERITELVEAMHEAGVDLPEREKKAQRAPMENAAASLENTERSGS
jgi:ABC-type transport system involved in cytochrome bd biosynthesis fused ATPase/permease subunit